MMKLDNLQENYECAKQIINHWPCDLKSLKFWRSSANVIFKIQCQNQNCYLRYSPLEERNKEAISVELEFIHHLRANHFPAVQPILSRNHRHLETVDTPWGTYHAVVFKEVLGQSVDYGDMTTELAFLHGKTMGSLHQLSSSFRSTTRQVVNWQAKLQWIKHVLVAQKQEEAALKECLNIQNTLQSYPLDKDNYGMIHYDFDSDNIFYDQTHHTCHVIDFGDAHYNWFLADVASTLKGMENDAADRSQLLKTAFIQGYTTQKTLSTSWTSDLQIFNRYHTLEHYAQILWSMQGYTPATAPDWMAALNNKFKTRWQKQHLAYQQKWPAN